MMTLSFVEFHFLTPDNEEMSITFSARIADLSPWLVQAWYKGSQTDPLIQENFDGIVSVGAAQFFALRALTLVKG